MGCIACSDTSTPSADSGTDAQLADAAIDAARDSATVDGAQTDMGERDGAAADGSTADAIVADGSTADAIVADGAVVPCATEIDALAAELYRSIGSCTVAVRLNYTTRAILGHQVFCGAYATTGEDEARRRAQADTGYGMTGTMLNATSPGDEFVFYLSPGDFGGAAAVSARTGLSVFGGSIIWSGTGEITYPATWRDPIALGSGCVGPDVRVASRGYDLAGGTVLSAADVDAALSVVLQTAVPGAMRKGGYLFDAVVLRYPRTVGAFNPATAEWIVLVNGGWLE